MSRLFVLSLFASLALLSKPVLAAPSGAKPNVVLITTDDHGYADLTIQGSSEIPTPFLDSIGERGVRFTNGYITAPLCGPSRAAFITGQYQQKVGTEGNAQAQRAEKRPHHSGHGPLLPSA